MLLLCVCYCAVGVCAVCCSMSMVIEDIVPLDPNDASVVTAAITSVVETDLPFTQLGEGDNRVRRDVCRLGLGFAQSGVVQYVVY